MAILKALAISLIGEWAIFGKQDWRLGTYLKHRKGAPMYADLEVRKVVE